MNKPREAPETAPENPVGIGAETAQPISEDDMALPLPIEENDANAQPG